MIDFVKTLEASGVFFRRRVSIVWITIALGLVSGIVYALFFTPAPQELTLEYLLYNMLIFPLYLIAYPIIFSLLHQAAHDKRMKLKEYIKDIVLRMAYGIVLLLMVYAVIAVVMTPVLFLFFGALILGSIITPLLGIVLALITLVPLLIVYLIVTAFSQAVLSAFIYDDRAISKPFVAGFDFLRKEWIYFVKFFCAYVIAMIITAVLGTSFLFTEILLINVIFYILSVTLSLLIYIWLLGASVSAYKVHHGASR